ncbi:MAG: hypothetical protein AVO39_07625 [delta proteobacterium MLS_D]|jgi:DNA-binding response OmpR family regulator|nr:MAG: hypothetical protein AVO39_07625 [delta proteobacterium MLS_D]
MTGVEKRREKILLVDDEPEILRILQEYFELYGYETCTAKTGDEALEKFNSFHPHAVLLDIIMPGRGGIDVLKEIKNKVPQTIVVIITAVIDESVIRTAMLSGADDYILKPFRLQDLDSKVHDLIDLRRQPGEA